MVENLTPFSPNLKTADSKSNDNNRRRRNDPRQSRFRLAFSTPSSPLRVYRLCETLQPSTKKAFTIPATRSTKNNASLPFCASTNLSFSINHRAYGMYKIDSNCGYLSATAKAAGQFFSSMRIRSTRSWAAIFEYTSTADSVSFNSRKQSAIFVNDSRSFRSNLRPNSFSLVEIITIVLCSYVEQSSRENRTHISDQRFSTAISTAFATSPAERYISTAVFGSFTFFAHSAFFRISDFVSPAFSDFTNSFKQKM